jgi:lipopolysaccharide/colanic/teichoic acid biosynthesis glycosyltransferase
MRRVIDIAVAVMALLLVSPLFLVIPIAILMDSPGNPFYGGWRVGKGGRPFRMWKFRTMVSGADERGCITGRNDSRITRLGTLLRRTKLDELPQFINLLHGDMTLVGPRPEAPQIVALYTEEQRRVLDVKPGVTGRVQLAAGEESDGMPVDGDAQDHYVRHLMSRKICEDLEYLHNRTPAADARIVALTTLHVLGGVVRPRHSMKSESN